MIWACHLNCRLLFLIIVIRGGGLLGFGGRCNMGCRHVLFPSLVSVNLKDRKFEIFSFFLHFGFLIRGTSYHSPAQK